MKERDRLVTESTNLLKKTSSEPSPRQKGKKENKKGNSPMFIPTLIMGALAIVLFSITTIKGGGQNITGLKSAGWMIIEILPLLIFAFIVAGYIQILIPRELLSRWVGGESGFRGI